MPYHGCTEVLKLIAFKFLSLERGQRKQHPSLQTLSTFLHLFLMNLTTSVHNGKCLWVRGDREGGGKEVVLSIPGFHITTPYEGLVKTYGVPSARWGWLGLMNGFNASRFSLIWSASKGKEKPVIQIVCKIIEINGIKQDSFVFCLI